KSGELLNLNKNNNFQIEKLEGSNCAVCECENNIGSNYCKHCGADLYEINDKSQFESIIKNNKSINYILEKFNIGKILLTSSLSLGILLVVSFFIKGFISLEFSEISYIINPLHIIMALNLGVLDGYSSTMVGSGSIEAHIGMLILLIMPVISIIISNFIFLKKENKDLNSVILNSIGFGISYGLMLAVISIFATVKSNPMDMIDYGLAINFRYRFSSLLINGFIIGFLTTYIFSFKKKYRNNNIYIDILKNAINTIAIGYILVFIILLILTLSDSSFLNEIGLYGYLDKFNIGIILSQLTAYVWEFANFIPISINNNIISILNTGIFFNTKLIFYSMIALSLLIILISGCNIKYKYKENGKKAILIFAISYAIIMGILAMFSYITVGGNISLLEMNNYKASIFMGTSITSTMIISFIYSYVVSWIGYKLNTF
ncbi:hypothetical protein, partial [Faecalimicrobium dakarense]|uniref:hypothetical protein n=1 Tax=Faecalimicrobium dakarense TaxID=1301100 RepID=UPI0005A8CF14